MKGNKGKNSKEKRKNVWSRKDLNYKDKSNYWNSRGSRLNSKFNRDHKL